MIKQIGYRAGAIALAVDFIILADMPSRPFALVFLSVDVVQV